VVGNTHRANCANAQRPGCECAGCGGSLHAQQGWRRIATEPPAARLERRRQFEEQLQTDPRTKGLRENGVNRLACLNLARLDIADYLWRDAGGNPGMSAIVEAVTKGSAESEFVNVVAEKLMEQTWGEISEAIDGVAGNDATAKDIKKRLADHLWCSMLLALVRVIEGTNKAIDLLADKTKELLKNAVGARLEHGVAKAIADAVVNVVVDKVWAALTDLVTTHFPILGEKSLRAFRILTVLVCPSVEKHPEVYEHAMKPLMDEGRAIVTEQIKAWLTSLFTGWWRKKGLTLAA
jgi:hypothetical protein